MHPQASPVRRDVPYGRMTVGAVNKLPKAPDAALLRAVQIGDLLPSSAVRTARARRLEATAFVVPGIGDLGPYLRSLDARSDELSAWDGRVVILAGDGGEDHRVIIVDRYGQVYEAVSAADAGSLPNAGALEEWFRFLATACPECGVIDDPRPRDWVP
jgi:hypothetical protein